MGTLITRLVEIQTNDGRTAVLDETGWRGNDPLLLAKLIEAAPIDPAYPDPLRQAANLACYTVGGRIVRAEQRHRAGLTGLFERLRRAITDTTLQKNFTAADELNQVLGSEQLRNLKMNRLIAAGMWTVAALVLCGAWCYLLA